MHRWEDLFVIVREVSRVCGVERSYLHRRVMRTKKTADTTPMVADVGLCVV